MTNQQGAPEALYASAMEFAAEKASISYVQRKCRCSWNDAEQMLERMVREGIIATYNGRKSAALVEAQQRATHVQNPSEIEHVAGDVSKNGPESNMAQQPALSVEWQCGQQASGFSQQPAPSAAAAVAIKAMGYGGSTGINDYLMSDGTVQAMRPSEVKWAPQPSPTPQADSQPAMTPETVYAAIAHGDEEHRAWLLSALRAVWCGEAVPPVASPIANAAADSQPAPVEVVDAMADSQYLAGVSAGWNAANADDPNAALQKLQESRAGYLKPLRAARAPADSVTAPAGGVSMRDDFEACWRRKYAPLPMNTRLRDDGRYGDPTIQQEWESWSATHAPTQPAQAADSQPAVSDLPPLPDPDLRDVGTKPQDVKDFLNGYATEYARLALAARAPADSGAAPAAYSGNLEQELAMLIRRIVSSARRNCEDGSNVLKLANEAWVYLVRKGLNGSPLRDAGIESDPTPPAQAADSVLEDAGGANWQDISTAPKDGTRFVAVGNNYGLYSETQHTCIAQWFRGCWIEASDWNEASELKYLTHWVPLLPLPGSAARKQGANHD